jgi:hypothetical protein
MTNAKKTATTTAKRKNGSHAGRDERINLAHRNAAHLDLARQLGCVIPESCYLEVWAHANADGNGGDV